MANTFVVLDLETTGLDYKTDQIIEIGAIKIDARYKEIERFHTLVALEDGRELPEFITKLTGITAQDLERQVPENIALTELAEFIGDSTVVAQNAPFDLSFISRGGIEPAKFICTRALVRYVEPELSASLKDVTARNGIALNGHHRALNDVEATIEVLRRYMGVVDAEVYDPINVVLDEPSRPLSYKPKNAIVRAVNYVALDNVELLRIFNRLPIGDPITERVGNIIWRTMKGSR